MALLLAGISSLLYGVADFTGGLATRRERVFPVVVYSQLIGLAGALVALLFLPTAALAPADLAFGAAAGLAGVTFPGVNPALRTWPTPLRSQRGNRSRATVATVR